MEPLWNYTERRKLKCSEKTCPSEMLSTINPTQRVNQWHGLQTNSGWLLLNLYHFVAEVYYKGGCFFFKFYRRYTLILLVFAWCSLP
jgi:hypothetical protein